METDEKELLAEKIARRLVEEIQGADANDFSQIQATLKDLQGRIISIEQRLLSHQNSALQSLKTLPHPSRERFALAETNPNEFNEFSPEEKACAFEPNGKPCDYCAMCSSRGF